MTPVILARLVFGGIGLFFLVLGLKLGWQYWQHQRKDKACWPYNLPETIGPWFAFAATVTLGIYCLIAAIFQ